MDNQHKRIKGYRDLAPSEIDSMNRIKELGAEVGALCLSLRERFQGMPTQTVEDRAEKAEALRWLEAGELQLQQGLMAITRGVARPTTF